MVLTLEKIPTGIKLPLYRGVEMINAAIEAADKAKTDSIQAKDSANQAVTTANEANQKSDYVQTQLDTVTGEGTIDPAVEQMKVGSDGTTVYASPDERVRKENQLLTTQMVDIDQQKAEKTDVNSLQSKIDSFQTSQDVSPNKDLEVVGLRTNKYGITFPASTNRIEEIEKSFNGSKNLYDETYKKLNKFCTGGTISAPTYIDNTSYNVTEVINVTAGKTVYFSNNGVAAVVRRVSLYNADGTYNTISEGLNSISSTTIPTGVTYMIVTYSNGYTKFQVEYDGVTTYGKFGLSLKEDKIDLTNTLNRITDTENKLEQAFTTSKNLYDASLVTSGKFMGTNGVPTVNASYKYSGKLPVIVGKTLHFSNDGVAVQARIVTAYNGDSVLSANSINYADTYLVPVNCTHVIVSYSSSYNKFQVEYDQVTVYAPYGIQIKDELLPDNPSVTSTIYADIPDHIYVASGRTIELYNNQVCINADKYRINWVCNVGKNLKRKFSVTGTDGNIGNYNLTLQVVDDDLNTVYSKAVTLHIVSNVMANSVNIAPIGDSLTNSKIWLKEMNDLSNGKILPVGTRNTGYTATDGVTMIKHEGRSGWAASTYLGNNSYTYDTNGAGSENPFWNPSTSKFDFAYYKTTYGVSPNAVMLFLGTNGITVNPDSNAGSIKGIVDAIRVSESTMPIFIVNIPYRSDQDGIGNTVSTDGYTQLNVGRYKYNEDMAVFNLASKLKELLSGDANVHFIPVGITHDSEYNYGTKTVAVNPRSTISEIIPADGVHPQDVNGVNAGYLQFADTMFSTIKGIVG